MGLNEIFRQAKESLIIVNAPIIIKEELLEDLPETTFMQKASYLELS